MNEIPLRRRFRWPYVAATLIVLVPLLVWAAAAPLLALLVQLELRRAGWTDAKVAGASIGLSGVVINRVTLASGDTFIVEGVRPRVGGGGVESLAISRLRMEAELTADGALVLPGAGVSDGGGLPLHLLPRQGIHLDRAAVALVTPAGDATVSMADVSVHSGPNGVELSGRYRLDHVLTQLEGAAAVEIGHDDFARIRLAVDGGHIEIGGFSAGGLTGEVLARRPATGAPAVTLVLRTPIARLAESAVGALGLEADWRGGVATFALTSADPQVLDVALEGRADLRNEKPTMGLAGHVLLKETAIRGQLSFDGELARAGPDAVTGRFHVAGRDLAFPIAYGDGRIDELTVDELTARWNGTVTGTADRLSVFASDCVAWKVGSVRLGGITLRDLGPPCMAPTEGEAIFAYDAGEGRARLAASTSPQPFAATAVDAEKESAIRGTWPASRMTVVLDADGLESLALEIAAGEVTLPGEQVSLRGVAGSAELSGRRAQVSLVAALESLSTPALWAPLHLEAGATGSGGQLAFDAVLSDPRGALVLEASGRYQDGAATSRLRLHPLRFFAGATQPGELFPILRENIQNTSGTIEFAGEISLEEAAMETAGTLTVRDLGATIAGVEIKGVETTIAFSSLLPPVTAPHQRMAVDEVLAGMPLQQGVVVYDMDSHGQVAVRHLEFRVAGGRIYSEPFIIDSADLRDIVFVLRAEEVDLSHVLAWMRIEGLEGTGSVSGRIPVRISARGLELDRGLLAAETTGVLRYLPRELPAFLQGDDVRSSMLREVLTNFHYEELSVQVMGESGDAEAQRVTLAARGANPDFLDGHPIELNVNFEGALLGAARSAAEISGAAEMQELSEQEGRGNEETTP